ncbi:MAG: NAD-dependent epimerase/dehydratase family protein [Dermatophilaceae bacterium]
MGSEVRPLAVVTGGSGFVGRHLVRALLGSGHRVRVIDRVAGTELGCQYVVADLVTDDVAGALQGDVVYHLAARPGVRRDEPEVEQARIRDNVLATERVAQAVPADVPLVFTSSSSVYGGTSGAPCEESGPLAPRGGYAWSKVAAEQICRDRAHSGGLVQIARLFTLIGEGQRPDMALALWAAAAAAGDPITVYGNLGRTRDFTDVAQAVEALICLARLSSPTVVNVGTGVGQSLAALLAAVSLHLGREPIVRIAEAPCQDPAATLAGTERLRSLMQRALSTDLIDVVGRYLGERAANLDALTEGQLT